MQSSVVVQRSESQNQLSNYDLYLILDCVYAVRRTPSVQPSQNTLDMSDSFTLSCLSVVEA